MDDLLVFGYCRQINTSINIVTDVIHVCLKFFRPNLFWEVRPSTKNSKQEIVTLIKNRVLNDCGIIYCVTRRDCRNFHQLLTLHSISSVLYHAALSKKERDTNQLLWRSDKIKIMIATSAYGQQIIKKDIRFIIHLSIPISPQIYYKQCSRAGLDGHISRCILYFGLSDRFLIEWLLSNKLSANKAQLHLLQQDKKKLYDMIYYCQNNVDCRRVMLSGFTDDTVLKEQCQMNVNTLDWCSHRKLDGNLIEKCSNRNNWHGCDNCNGQLLHVSTKIDVTQHALNICNVVKKLDKKDKRSYNFLVKKIFLSRKGKDLSFIDSQRLMTLLLSEGILKEEIVLKGGLGVSTSVIELGSKYPDMEIGEKKLYMTIIQKNPNEA